MSFGPRPRRRRWLVVAVVTAAVAALLLVQGRPAPVEPLAAVPVGSDPADRGGGDESPQATSSDDLVDAAVLDERDGGELGDDVANDLPGPVGDAAFDLPAPSGDAAFDLPPPVAEVDGLVLLAPATQVVVVGFHEASSAAFAMEPIGRLLSNENTTRFDPIGDREGTPYHILSSRGRVHPPTSALDVVLEDDEPVLAPVSGVVADVREYELYGRHLDHRVEIHPYDAPHLRIVLVHLDDVRVQEGDVVQAGVSVLAGTANRFPFASQIDRETEPDRWPHVHLEVQPIDAPRPGDEPDEDETGEHGPSQPLEDG